MDGNKRDFETVPLSGKNGLGIRFLYNCFLGRLLLKLLIRRTVSRFMGWILRRRISKVFIRGFIRRNKIDMNEYESIKYKSFNDFFIRELKVKPVLNNPSDLVAPCDGKLTVYNIASDSVFNIKNSTYTVEELLKDKELADEFAGGLCLIFRLMPVDYHRYIYVDSGKVLSRKKIKGMLHAVRPISQNRYKVFKQNAREYEVMQTERFGKTIQIEVGALFVGRIANHKTDGDFKRGEEKGMFEFGGSTIVMLFKKDAVKLDEVFYTNTQEDNETIVKMGWKIGKSCLKGE